MKLSFLSLMAGTPLMTALDQIYSRLAASFLEIPEYTLTILGLCRLIRSRNICDLPRDSMR